MPDWLILLFILELPNSSKSPFMTSGFIPNPVSLMEIFKYSWNYCPPCTADAMLNDTSLPV